jgi:hypothetical protein
MLKILVKNLFKTFIYSTLVAIIILRASYYFDESFVRAGLDTSFKGLPEFLICYNILILVASLPVLLLAIKKIYYRKALRVVIYYGSTTLFFIIICSFLFKEEPPRISAIALISLPILIFLVIHTYFYLRLVDNRIDTDNSSTAISKI